MNDVFIDPSGVAGLPETEWGRLRRLVETLSAHQSKNEEKNVYYEGRISLNRVNLGIALPEGLRGLEIGCAWGAKCVERDHAIDTIIIHHAAAVGVSAAQIGESFWGSRVASRR